MVTPVSTSDESDRGDVVLRVKWNGKFYTFALNVEDSIGDLKLALQEQSGVLIERQKLLVGGRILADTFHVSDLQKGKPLVLIGTPEAELQKMLNDEEAPVADVLNDLDLDYREVAAEDSGDHIQQRYQVFDLVAVQRKIERRIRQLSITFTSPPRPGKNLLVVDIDHTIYDHRSTAESIQELARPGLHELMRDVYPYYDICLWSQTHWRHLEAKVTELGMLMRDDYRVSFVLDRTWMFSVTSRDRRSGTDRTHEVKPLSLIWEKIPCFNERNTVHIDDLSSNFALNPRNGVKVAAFRRAPLTRATDRELFAIRRYLLYIAETSQDLSSFDHRDWKSAARRLP